jgi:hypothetical protein
MSIIPWRHVSCLIGHHTMKTYWGLEVYLHSFLTSALDGGEWSVSLNGHFFPLGKSPRYPLDRRLGGHQSRSGRGSNYRPLHWLSYPVSLWVLTSCWFRNQMDVDDQLHSPAANFTSVCQLSMRSFYMSFSHFVKVQSGGENLWLQIFSSVGCNYLYE